MAAPDPRPPDRALLTRPGLPDALRALLTEIPRETWMAHPEFGGTVQFWLERHLMFRQVLGQLTQETQGVLDRTVSPDAFAPWLSRMGGSFLQNLHGHHSIEDEHYFPQLVGLDPRLSHGFEILDADHHALDGWLNGFADGANAVLRAQGAAAHRASAAFLDQLTRLERLLNRHLTDEEEIIVPVILKSGFRG